MPQVSVSKESFEDFLGQEVRVGDKAIVAEAMSTSTDESPLVYCTILGIRQGCLRYNHHKHKIKIRIEGYRNPTTINSAKRFIKLDNRGINDTINTEAGVYFNNLN